MRSIAEIRKEVIAEMGAVKHPNKEASTHYIHYHKGEIVGRNNTNVFRNLPGVVETVFDEAAYDADVAAYRLRDTTATQRWYDELRSENDHLGDSTFLIVYQLAYEDGHSAGYDEVGLMFDKHDEFAMAILRADLKDRNS